MARTIRGLALACHPMPALAVTAFAAAFGATVGLPAGTLARLAVAVLTGQLSIGWLNDLVDRDIDRRAGRRDKPLAADAVSVTAVRVAMTGAAAICVVTSLALGVLPGLLHLGAVASAYTYDVRLKWTAVSWLPFAISFGVLPCVATTSLAHQPFPPFAIIVAGAALGVGAHFANTVNDVDADTVTGVRGLPQRLGPRWSLVVAAVSVTVAGAAVVAATPRAASAWVLSLLAVLATIAAAVLAERGSRRLAFPGVVLGAGLVVVGVVLSGTAVGP